MIEPAAFSFKEFRFDKVKMDFSVLESNELRLEIKPYGVFYTSQKTFELDFFFSAYSQSQTEPMAEKTVLEINCISWFDFKNVETVEDIPDFFYSNSLAIVFPYVRAFISNITLQSNIKPLVLPTMNLSGLKEELIKNMDVKQ